MTSLPLFDSFAAQVISRTDDVLSTADLSAKAHRLLVVLRAHQGAARAVPLDELMHELSLGDRSVKALVQDLCLTHGIQIGRSRQLPSGYFLVASEDEAIESTRPMYAQAMTELRVIWRTRRGAASIRQFLQQISLDLDSSCMDTEVQPCSGR